ncbi:centrosomal protein of 55 kDa [Syngnathoides biaculeatus]|uniref:centrosomal protein of 55 kDa n=1 Tax=Syngnathoides biaculeatus TaxID=300417 RepID=UPI002ADE5410|nr:centrosomal protein of 55 kDa [Syngnathoides biaculeatus]XP_061666550.1 centrosomal protein of 55 kDa [Syngnathoides biaculeatus]XP_061666551.1 centrosomal protein of 55 kDa [Syngnathoides biaculeatus]XP_061666552.1 centrosomal protein of 55 kDa [Syngnathoides biaculeatus]XP_061666553.1 centrosomal protein of 55 kDa [Syngnathoides biaculeatus]
MTSKGAKDSIVAKLGFKSGSSSSKAEAEVERVRRENAHLRKKMEELTKRHIKPPDADKSKLLERIVSLETLRERNNQQLLLKEQELETVRQQLSAKGGEVVAALQSQLDQRRKDAEKRDLDFQKLLQETENLKNKLATVSARCQSLETQALNGQASTADLALVRDQLKDALEKNQQWLVYDQQREAFVQSVLARTHQLEQRPDSTSTAAAGQDAASESSEKEAQIRSHYEQSVLDLQKQLEEQKDHLTRARQELVTQKEEGLKSQAELRRQTERAARLQEETAALQRRLDAKCDELEEARVQMQTERLSSRNAVSSDRADRMRAELESLNLRLEEERKRSAELLLQVNLLQKSLLSQNEEQRRIAALEQQIQLSVKDFENEKMDRQTVQHQLHKVLKELRKARDQIAKLESSKQPSSRFSEPGSYNKLDVERLSLDDARSPTSPNKVGSLLDESFLECPRCRAHYPTSRHRELLAHIDFCLA